MITDSKELSKIEPGELDDYLARGWFRMQQTIFTTDKIIFNDFLYEAIWLRVCLTDFQPDKKYRELHKKNNKFKTEIKKGSITSDHEALFSLYREGLSFESYPSLRQLLLGDTSYNVYNTYMINLYDGKQMIGAGFFDLGKNSAAGICCIYDPGYKTYGLGRYMIYEKMLYCKKNKLSYFYPGYFVPGYVPFDYKLTIGKPAIEYFDIFKRRWFSMTNFSFADYLYNS
jgi:leucyl-tRNA---protein transferase